MINHLIGTTPSLTRMGTYDVQDDPYDILDALYNSQDAMNTYNAIQAHTFHNYV